MKQDDPQISPLEEDEIDLIGIIRTLVARKFLIFGLTGFIALVSILYASSIPPIYKASTSFTSPSDSVLLSLEKMQLSKDVDRNKFKSSVFAHYLTGLSSRELHKAVFIDGGYFAQLNPKNQPVIDIDIYISGFIKSIKLSPPEVTKADMNLGFLIELPYTLSIEGKNAKVISNYLNDLVEIANKNTINQFIGLYRKEINQRLEEIDIERQLLLMKGEYKLLREIDELSFASEIANSLGIKENNLSQINSEVLSSNVNIAFGRSENLPMWYLYGEKALNEQIKNLKLRSKDIPFNNELVNLDLEKRSLESIILDSSNLNAMSLNQSSITPIAPISPNKRFIVLLATLCGFIFSIFLALVMSAFKKE